MSVTVISKLKIQNAANSGIVDDFDMTGGFRVVPDHTARDALLSETFMVGMWCRTMNDGITWELIDATPTWARVDDSQYLLTAGTRALTGDMSMGGHRLTNGVTPVTGSEFVIKSYVDGVASGLDIKPHVRVRFAVNQALAGLPVDGAVSLTDGQRALLDGQTTASEKGIWIVHTGAWTRPVDFAAGSSAGSAFVFVQEGTYADTGWVCTSDAGSDVVGTNALTFTQFSGAGVLVADETTLTKSGSVFSIKNGGVGDTQISAVSPSKIAQASAGTGQALVWSGSAWAPSTNFGAQNLTTTGAMILGTNAASAGDLRMKQGASAYARSFPNTGNIAIFDVGVTGGADTLTFGGNSGVPLGIIGSPVSVIAAGGATIAVGATGYLFFTTNFQTNVPLYRFTGNVCAIQIDPIAVAGSTGGLMSFVGQDATGTGTTVGGPILLRSGSGVTDGTIEIRHGSTRIFDYGLTNSARTTVGDSSKGTQVVGNSLFLIAGGVQVGITSAAITLAQTDITFAQNAGDITISIADDATTNGVGKQMTIRPRDETGTGTTIGGKLLLRSGTGATNGVVELQVGLTSALLFNGATANFNANQLVTTNSYKVNSGTGFLQVGTDTASVSSEAAQTGTIRLYYGSTMKGRSSSFTGDVQLWDWGVSVSGFFTIGSTTGVNLSICSIGPMQINVGASSYIFYDAGGTPRLDFGGVGLSLNAGGLILILPQAVNSVNGLNLALQAQNSTGTGTLGGDVLLVPGTGTTHNGNVAIGASTSPTWQAMAGGVYLKNASNVPTGNPASGGFLYTTGGALHYLGSSGTNTTVGAAEPHCPKCDRDFALEWTNVSKGEHLAVCTPCLIDALIESGHDHTDFAFIHKMAAG